MKRLIQLVDGEEVVHYMGAPFQHSQGYTLCGMNVFEDAFVHQGDCFETNRRVTCSQCRDLVDYVRGRTRRLDPTTNQPAHEARERA
jgi:hypothetical protein